MSGWFNKIWAGSPWRSSVFSGIGIWLSQVVSALVITDIVATVLGSDVTITWTTDINSDSVVEYGPTAAYGSSVGDLISQVTSHSITIFGLADGLFHYRVSSKTPTGSPAYSDDKTFVMASRDVAISGFLPTFVVMRGARQTPVGVAYLNESNRSVQ